MKDLLPIGSVVTLKRRKKEINDYWSHSGEVED